MEIPGLLEDLDLVRATEDSVRQAEIRNATLLACGKCHNALMAWEDEVGPQLLVYDYIASGKPLPIPKTDVDTALLQITNLYWVVGILLYSTIGLLKKGAARPATPQQHNSPSSYLSPPASISSRDSVDGASPSQTPMRAQQAPPQQVQRPDPRRDPKLCAYKIAHSVHLFWEPAAGAFGNHIGLFPLGVAMRYLANVEPIEGSEPYGLMRALFRRPFLGTQVGTFLSNLQKQTPKANLQNMEGDAGIRARAQVWWNEGEKPTQPAS